MFKVILYMPEKPSNVGNIIRTCNATETKLVIIGPLSFNLDDKALKRAGMDYISLASIKFYPNYDEFIKDYKHKKIFYVTRYSKKLYSSLKLDDPSEEYIFMFGRESSGIPHDILRSSLDNCIRIPMAISARSLNLSNSVAIVLYEGLRQSKFYNLATSEVIKGEDFLINEGKD